MSPHKTALTQPLTQFFLKIKPLINCPVCDEEIGICSVAYTTVWRLLLLFFAMVAQSGEGWDSFETAGFFSLVLTHRNYRRKKRQLKTALKQVHTV